MGIKSTPENLKIIERARENLGWQCQSDEWCNAAGVSLATLGRFRGGNEVSKENFISICRAVGVNWRDVVDKTLPGILDPYKYWDGVPDVSTFHGRKKELIDLEECIVNRCCRVVALLGAAGIGKTALAIKLAEDNQFKFDYLIWYPLRYASPLEQGLTDILEFLYKKSNSNRPKNIQNISDRISELMKFFRNYRCLLIIDKLDTIFSSGEYAGSYQEECKNYCDLIERIGQEHHQSCLIITSRETNREIEHLEGINSPVQEFRLRGLEEEAARKILEAKGLVFTKEELRTLNQYYKGNPKILNMVASTIISVYNGRVEAFLDRITSVVTGDIEDFIGQQFDRLTDLEKNILSQLVNQTQPISLSRIQEILSISQPELDKAIESLIRRSLIERSDDNFTLDPVVIDYVKDRYKLKPEED